MLTSEENEYLCRVGPGTAMGALLRRYWLPICLSSDVAEPDSPPRKFRVVGEDFVVFRDSSGTVGVLDEKCMHRGASLAIGRVEDCGIRCLYHGWKFGADGSIHETPNLPDSRFRKRLRAPAHPVHEAGQIVWVYLGPADKQPPPPSYVWMNVPPENLVTTKMVLRGSFIQGVEGEIDSSHVGLLHQTEVALARTGTYDPDGIGRDRFPTTDDAPLLEVEDTAFGFHYAAIRKLKGDQEGKSYVRVTPFIMPFQALIPPMNLGFLYVPIDDTHTCTYVVTGDPEKPLDKAEWLHWRSLEDVQAPDYLLSPVQDREAMAAGTSFSGVPGLIPQDALVTDSMDDIVDRSKEHLVAADVAVVRMRRLLIEAARRLEAGEDPVGLDGSVDWAKYTAGSGVIPEGTPWQTLVPGNTAT
ncbi:Rieske 2Fe-2S domain-containing protein [Amycolatopsis carbonis]|uniref:Rieske 2Fe-2S domain-containing protein n=1 Tax=Amycolatopsis carbonis TaxID=715471 RepID=A0A9Y2IPK8_9PSEU|nr:Rieske 2Fe-2S domain-containing protein [Amycolatopsis sp. 2-15]WIX82821.1 Rieske 2Fe-2S domain-containing protein [Amycolatopsis sp. 2-15]